MLEKILRFLEKYIIPKPLYKWGQPIYHSFLSCLAALYYGFPSRKMIIIGVTGTGGKSTTVNLIAKILEGAGFKVGLSSTMNFKIGEKEWINDSRMTMPGRFALQKMLKQMVISGCKYAVIETSSEGITQFRHLNINYDVAVFTNLTPEHLESHGGFGNYKKAKGKLFENLSKGRKKQLLMNGKLQEIKKVSIINLDDDSADYFLRFKAEKKIGYGIENCKLKIANCLKAENIQFSKKGSNFLVNGVKFNLKLLGAFNVYNALAAISVGLSQAVDLENISKTLEKIENLPGRMEEIACGQPFKIFVDYAHTPDSLEKVYQAILEFRPKDAKLISVLGSSGGGRDKSKRPIFGKLASQYADYVIITNEDPHDEDPQEIINQISYGLETEINRKKEVNYWQILDRREAIKKALALAQPNDIVLVTGKGCEQSMIVKKDQKIAWDDRLVIKELLELRTNNFRG